MIPLHTLAKIGAGFAPNTLQEIVAHAVTLGRSAYSFPCWNRTSSRARQRSPAIASTSRAGHACRRRCRLQEAPHTGDASENRRAAKGAFSAKPTCAPPYRAPQTPGHAHPPKIRFL